MRKHIVCVLRSGGDYEPRYVQALYDNMCGQGMEGKFTFHVLTDYPDEAFLPWKGELCMTPLLHKWPGWWSKLELFRSDLCFNKKGNRVLFIDLDTVVLEPLDEMFEQPHPLIMLRGFRHDHPASGLMAWDGGECPAYLYEHFATNPTRWQALHRRGGDQAFIAATLKDTPAAWQDLLPGWVVSYKRHIRNNHGILPNRARVVCFHGKPRPWHVDEDWAQMWQVEE
jgi:hypothetical protein